MTKNKVQPEMIFIKRFMELSSFRKQQVLQELWAKDDFNRLTTLIEEWKHELGAEESTTVEDQLQLLYWDALTVLEQRFFDKALATIKKAVEVLENTNIPNQSSFLARFYLLEARIYLQMEQPEISITPTSKALAIIQQLGDDSLLVQGLTLLAQAEYRLHQHDKAHQHFMKALDLIPEDADPQLSKIKAIVFRNLSVLHKIRNELEIAINYLKQALLIFKQLGNRRQVALTLLELARIHHYMNQAEASLQYHLKAEEIFRELHDDVNLALTLSDQARIHSHLRQFDLAAKKLREASTCLSESVSQSQEWKNHMLVGSMCCRQGNVEQAIYHFKEAVSISRSMKDEMLEARANYNLAAALLYQGQYQQARNIAEKVLSRYLREKNVPSSRLALVYQLLGEIFLHGFSMYMTARYYLEKALVHSKNAENLERQTSIKLDLIKIAIFTQNLDEARRDLEQLEPTIEGLSPDVASEYHFTKGLYHETVEQYKEALTHHELARNMCPQDTDPFLLMMILYHAGKCLNNMEQSAKSIETLKEALNIAESMKNKDFQAKIHEELAKAWESLEVLEKAVTHWEAIIDIYSSSESETPKLLSTYMKLVDLYDKLGDHEKMNEAARTAGRLMAKVRHEMR